MSDVLPLLIGGLVLFIYSIAELSESLRTVFTDRARVVIKKFTPNAFAAILVGIVLTILVGSSSAVIILAIVFINARALTFRQAIGIILGANIGTTFSSQIFALDIGKYMIIPMTIGLLIEIFARKPLQKNLGKILLYFGMLFFGLFIIELSVAPLKESKIFIDWVLAIENNHIQGALIGGLITLIIQSSSATVGIAIVLGRQEIVSLAGGIAVMLGAELGTCSDTLIATIRGSRQALKAGLFHLFFNLTTIIIGLILFEPFVQLVIKVSNGQTIDNQIANAHMMFNILGVLLLLPGVGLAERILNKLIPEQELS